MRLPMFYEQSIGDKILKESHKFEKKPIALDKYVLNLASIVSFSGVKQLFLIPWCGDIYVTLVMPIKISVNTFPTDLLKRAVLILFL